MGQEGCGDGGGKGELGRTSDGAWSGAGTEPRRDEARRGG